MITACCACQKMKNNGIWLKTPSPVSKIVSHGYCPDCFKKLQLQLDTYIRSKRESFMSSKGVERRKGEDRRQQPRKQLGKIRHNRRQRNRG